MDGCSKSLMRLPSMPPIIHRVNTVESHSQPSSHELDLTVNSAVKTAKSDDSSLTVTVNGSNKFQVLCNLMFV
jgi:hypothetical protein